MQVAKCSTTCVLESQDLLHVRFIAPVAPLGHHVQSPVALLWHPPACCLGPPWPLALGEPCQMMHHLHCMCLHVEHRSRFFSHNPSCILICHT